MYEQIAFGCILSSEFMVEMLSIKLTLTIALHNNIAHAKENTSNESLLLLF